MSKRSSRRLDGVDEGRFGLNLEIYNHLSLNGRVYVSQDELRKGLLDPTILSAICQLVGGEEVDDKETSFRTRVARFSSSTAKREQKMMVRAKNIAPAELSIHIGEEDTAYLSWFMYDKDPSQYEILLVEQGALETQGAINFYQSKYGCLDENSCVVFSHLSLSDQCVVIINSDRLDALRIVALPHTNGESMLPLHPLYTERLSRAAVGVNAQWRYRYTVKSLLVYTSMMISDKWRHTVKRIASMGSETFNVYAMLPRIMSLWDSEAEIQQLIKDAYLVPNSQYNFVRGLKAFVMQDAKHWIHRDVYDLLCLRVCMLQNDFFIHRQIMETISRQGNLVGKKWIEITPYKTGVTRGKSEYLPSRKATVLVDERGNQLDTNIPFHTWIYQLLLSDKLTLELRKSIFLGMSLDADGGRDDKRVAPLDGAGLWDDFVTDRLDDAPYETCLVPLDAKSVQVKEAYEMVSILSVLSGLEYASRMKTKDIQASEDLSGRLKPRLKHILTGQVDFPVVWNKNDVCGPVYFANSFPSVEFRMNLEESQSATNSTLTREFVEFHYLHRNPIYYEIRAKISSPSPLQQQPHKRARQLVDIEYQE